MPINKLLDKPIHCLILSAGLGTRMGQIGKELPKVLWPIFEKKLIELQIAYAKELGIEKIFINVHHQYEQITSWFNDQDFENVTLVHEKELLLIGGAVHNVRNNYLKETECNLLVLNGDQFLIFDKKFFYTTLMELDNEVSLLYGIHVDKREKYNAIIEKCGKMTEIKKCEEILEDKYLTYSGMAIINMDKLDFKEGPSHFFDTVSNYKKQDVLIRTAPKYEYWDFGTISRYHEQMYKLLSAVSGDYYEKYPSKFLDFCMKQNVFNLNKIKGISNYSNSSEIEQIELEEVKINRDGIYYKNLFDQI